MPEQAMEGVVTNTGQPIVIVGAYATERELAIEGKVTPVGNVTVVGTPAAE